MAAAHAAERPAPGTESKVRVLFRERALAAHQSGVAAQEPLRVAPIWTRWTILVGSLVVASALFGAVFLRVELISTGRGILQASGPPHVLAAQTEGRIVAVSARAGDRVTRGQELVRLESTNTMVNLVEAERSVALARKALNDFRERKQPLYARRHEQLTHQANSLQSRTKSGQSTVARMARRARSFDVLGKAGLTSDLDVDQAKEAISAATREALRSEEDGARLLDQIAALELEELTEGTRLTEDLGKAEARRDALQVTLEACVVRAPADGVLGAVPVRVGDTVMTGTALGRVVPLGSPTRAVAYVAERDRAFLRPNASVRIEVDQLPIWEFGAIHGHILSVGSELATSADLQATFGDRMQLTEPLYRVDVAIDTNDDAFRSLAPRLRAESLAVLRFTLRRQRVVTVLFEPLKRWLQ